MTGGLSDTRTRAVGQSCGVPPRVAIMPPVPVPYREPLFRALAGRGRVQPHVLYMTASQPGWDQPHGWFAAGEGYASEVLGARWNEIDAAEAVWTVPASRMKMKRAHRVPLTPRRTSITCGRAGSIVVTQ